LSCINKENLRGGKEANGLLGEEWMARSGRTTAQTVEEGVGSSKRKEYSTGKKTVNCYGDGILGATLVR